MKMKMKTYSIQFGLLLFSLAWVTGCEKYDQPGESKTIYVNKQSLSMFVGERIQLTASPTQDTYSWSTENGEVASVTSDGIVEAVNEGETHILVRCGDAVTKVPVTVVKRIPLEDVIMSETSLDLLVSEKKRVLVTHVPEDANDIPSFNWYSENPEIATVDRNGKILVVRPGKTTIVYRIGNIEKRITVNASFTKPFKGPHILSATTPCEIAAAHFDLGGEGYAFHDADKKSHTNDNYRRNNGDPHSAAVEIEGNGVNIGYTNKNEWLLYTVEVVDAGAYLADVSLSANSDNGKFYLEIDEETRSETIAVPNNYSWSSWRWIPSSPPVLNLGKGTHTIKFYFEEAGFNLRALRFTRQG